MSKALIRNLINLTLGILIVPIAWVSYTEIGKILGLRPTPVEVAGTGSMYPSLFWDESQGGPEKVSELGVAEYRSSPLMYHYYPGFEYGYAKLLLKSTLSRGDMVAFNSDKTREILTTEGKDPNLGFIKRIIALPGDQVELRDGFVYLNTKLLNEPYIRTPRSTYGGSSLAECITMTIPPDHYFVLGDNRKVSSDSRFELGLISAKDVQFYLPLSKQGLYTPLWRDTSRDESLSGQLTLNVQDLYPKLAKLKSNKLLEKSAHLRGEALLTDPKTHLDLSASLKQAGYHNIVTGEFVIYGHFTADELWENLQANYNTRVQLSNPDYSEIGISVVAGKVAGCPTQVIVGQLGGYIPASYATDVIESWQKAKANLAEIIPSWEHALNQTGVDQNKLGDLLALLHKRQALVDEVLTVMNNREWINADLQSRIDADTNISAQAEDLARQLNEGR